jgi:hypothetical protein
MNLHDGIGGTGVLTPASLSLSMRGSTGVGVFCEPDAWDGSSWINACTSRKSASSPAWPSSPTQANASRSRRLINVSTAVPATLMPSQSVYSGHDAVGSSSWTIRRETRIGIPVPARIDASTLSRATRIASRRDLQLGRFAETGASRMTSLRQKRAPLTRLSQSYPKCFSCSFLRQRAQLGRQRHTDGQESVAVVWQRVPRGGTRCQNDRSVRYRAQGTKTTNNTTDHRTSITSLPRSHTPTITTNHLASHHQQPSFRCLTTHTRSWGWVVKHQPHPAIFSVAGPKRLHASNKWV